jgi:protein-S-isoprenylcysteine O-methyltransferase Ste14
MKRWLFLAYGIGAHAAFLAVYAYLAGFVGNLVVPRSIDAPATGSTAAAVAVNLLDLVVWDVQQPLARGVLWGMFAAGWLAVPLVSVLINHFDLFGTRQVWLYFQGKPYTPLPFRTPLLYARVRHPLYLGWALAFWATPTMTAGHLLFAGSLTVYMMLAAVIEERDLVGHFGRAYREYQKQVPMFVPRIGRLPQPASEAAPRGPRREPSTAPSS